MTKKLSPCSVLICVYGGNSPEHFEIAINSMIRQTVPPNDVVVVVDGPIPKKLGQALRKLKSKSKIIQIVYLDKNYGVGKASNEGLRHCKYELVAKMDADDIAEPDRLEKQLEEFAKRKDLVLSGGQLAEFIDNDPGKIVSYRQVPTTYKGILKFTRKRDPFNNQTVMFKKSVILAEGGYPPINRAEDYYLYAKIIAAGHMVSNLPDVLVKYRLTPDALARRKSWQNTKEMIATRNKIRKLGVSNYVYFILAVITQLGLFIMPLWFTKWFYKRMRKNG